MIAFIQKQNGEWLNENCYVAQYGFNRMGYNIKSFEKDDAKNIKLDNTDVVFGGINTTHAILEQNGIEIPKVPNILDLNIKFRRKVFKSTLKDVRDNKIEYPFFVKPFDTYKLFTGFVCQREFNINRISHVSDDVEVFVSSVVEFISEYRCFVLNNELVGCKNYTGDFTLSPAFEDFNYIKRIISQYKNSPSAYTLDIGILEDGGDYGIDVIEINDGYGFGAYGLNPIIYCKMIASRWLEIFNKK